jgi:SAM-dependent methyltransferase
VEALPFAERRFDAVVSQFGFEYGHTGKAADELARVLVPDGRVSLLVHHAESTVVAVNRARLDALHALQARGMRDAFVSGNVETLTLQMWALRRKHPYDTLVAELARALPPRMAGRTAQRHAVWTAVDEALQPERRILESMTTCCIAPDELAEWLVPLHSHCNIADAGVLREPGGAPIAWQIAGTRRPSISA